MQLTQRIQLLCQLGNYIQSNTTEWQEVKLYASQKNGWFTPEFIDIACNNIANNFLQKNILEQFVQNYSIENSSNSKKIGVVMAGNITMVGFHDFMCCFISGHTQVIKYSEKDNVLLAHLIAQMQQWDIEVNTLVQTAEMLKNCDAYIATGSSNTARYFDQYFGKYPNIIRKNKTSVAVLTGNETEQELALLADDTHLYFGLGCRNVTHIYVPEAYNFVPLLTAFKKYDYMSHHNKYKNNYDYNLAIHILNKAYYMTNETTLLIESEQIFSPISQVNYSYYKSITDCEITIQNNPAVQCIVGTQYIPFGQAQIPLITQYADGVDTMQFLCSL